MIHIMAAIDYLISRVTLFIILCVIWLSLNGRLHVQLESVPEEPSVENPPESNEPPPPNKLRPVNLIIINDTSNPIADKSIVASLNALYKKDQNLIGRVLTLKVDGVDPKKDLERICDVWDGIVKQASHIPDLVLDTTKSGYAAETVSAFTAAVGVPTLSAQYGREGEIKNWKDLNSDQSKYLIQVIPSIDLLTEGVKQFVYQMNISNAGVIFDEDFIMDYKYKKLFDDSKTRFIAVPMKSTEPEVRHLLYEMRRIDIVNYFIFGNMSTVKTVLNVGYSNNFVGTQYGWYVLSQYDEEPRCNCKKLSVISLKPLRSKAILEHVKNVGIGKWRIEPVLTSSFYFDLARIGITAMKESILNGKWPTDSEYLTCEDFNGTNTPSRNFDYYSELIKAESKFHPTFASFVWNGINGQNYAKFEMTAKMVTINNNVSTNLQELGTWPGVWNSHFKIKNEEAIKKHIGVMRYRITTVIKAPFVMYDAETRVWSGYCIDLIEKLSSKLNFTYSIKAVKDKKYGMINKKGHWDGMIRELLLKRADIALGALSVMAERESVIDFTVPIYDLVGFSILMRKPKRPTKLFKFLNVLSDEAWLSLLASLFITSIFLTIFNRWSPYSYRNNLEKFKDDDEKRDFTLRESLWFSMTSLTPHGGGIAPKNLSGRIVAATWWLFGFIIIASYTANLSAFLTISRLETMVESLDDLSKQYTIHYAPIIDSEAYIYFKRMADIEQRFYNIWHHLILSPKITELERSTLGVWEYPHRIDFTKMLQSMDEFTFPSNMSEALERVRRENNRANEFAFIGDANDIKYLTMTNCDLMEIGTEFSRKPYALGVQQGSPLRESLNNAILELANERELEKLKKRWWDNNPAQVQCEEQELLSDGISMANIGGIFLLTIVGIGLAIVTLMFEYYWYRCRPQKKMNFNRKQIIANEETMKSSPKPAKIAFKSAEIKSK